MKYHPTRLTPHVPEEKMTDDQEQRTKLLKRIKDTRRRIANHLRDLEPQGARLTNGSIIFGGIAALLGGIQLAFGHGHLPKTIDPNGTLSAWQLLAAAAAVSAGFASISGQLYKSREIASKLAKVQSCDAKLEGLETSLDLGHVTIKEADTRYGQWIVDIAFVPADSPQPDASGAGALDSVRGQIAAPAGGTSVPRVIACSGSASGVGANVHLWLAVEVKDLVWPKEGQILPEDDGSWTATVFEDGAVDEFSLALVAADRRAHKKIQAWLDSGKKSGRYRELRYPPGTRRVDRVERLRLAR
jgi:hypothetical protein